MPPIVQNRKTYIVSTRQLLAWKKAKKEAADKLGFVKIIQLKDNVLEINNCGEYQAYDVNGKLL